MIVRKFLLLSILALLTFCSLLIDCEICYMGFGRTHFIHSNYIDVIYPEWAFENISTVPETDRR